MGKRNSPQIAFRANRLQFSDFVNCPTCGRRMRVFVDIRNGTKSFDVTGHEEPLCGQKFGEDERESTFDDVVWEQLDKIWSDKADVAEGKKHGP